MNISMKLPNLSTSKIYWSHLAWFLGLTFGLSWIVDLVLYLNGGLNNPATTMMLQFQMLLPAFSAIVLGAFFFKESPIYFKTNRRTSRWFVYYFMVLTFLYLIGQCQTPQITPTKRTPRTFPSLINSVCK